MYSNKSNANNSNQMEQYQQHTFKELGPSQFFFLHILEWQCAHRLTF